MRDLEIVARIVEVSDPDDPLVADYRDLLAVADKAAAAPVERLVAGARRLAVLEGVGDHENLGALFRNAAAFGVDGVLLGPGCADPLYRRSVRVSMGHVLAVPFARLE